MYPLPHGRLMWSENHTASPAFYLELLGNNMFHYRAPRRAADSMSSGGWCIADGLLGEYVAFHYALRCRPAAELAREKMTPPGELAIQLRPTAAVAKKWRMTAAKTEAGSGCRTLSTKTHNGTARRLRKADGVQVMPSGWAVRRSVRIVAGMYRTTRPDNAGIRTRRGLLLTGSSTAPRGKAEERRG